MGAQVPLEGDDLSAVSWNHRPTLVREALQSSGGFAQWKPRWHLLVVPTGGSRGRRERWHIMAAYDHYRYRAAQIENKGLSRTDDWMADKLKEASQELRVWGLRP